MPTWNDLKDLATDENLPLPIVAAEPLQIAFLDGLYAEKEGLKIVFHGGTSIRLLHGGYRYSEDLDFCVSEDAMGSLDGLMQKAYRHAENLLALYLGEARTELRKKEGQRKIASWWFNVQPPGERQKYKVKIEFGIYPVYSRQTIPVTVRNRLVPRQPAVISVGVNELLADKVCALADRPYTKERDFFDVWYLTSAMAARLDETLLRSKFSDYRATLPAKRLEERMQGLNGEGFARSMDRFLPRRYRDLLSSNDYRQIIDASRQVMSEALGLLL